MPSSQIRNCDTVTFIRTDKVSSLPAIASAY